MNYAKEENKVLICDHCGVTTDEMIIEYIASELTNAMLDKLSKLGFKKVSFKTMQEYCDSCDYEYELLVMDGKAKIKVYLDEVDKISIEIYRLVDGVWVNNNLNRDLNPYF